jgi:receptor expression-enhancing protein 1/2/3/4
MFTQMLKLFLLFFSDAILVMMP